MTYHVYITARAAAEIDAICDWIAVGAPHEAERWSTRLHDAIRGLAVFPRRGRIASESRFFEQEIRQVVFGRYRILFTIEGKTVIVVGVRHGARRRSASARMNQTESHAGCGKTAQTDLLTRP